MITRVLSVSFMVLAVALVAYGLFGCRTSPGMRASMSMIACSCSTMVSTRSCGASF